MIPEELFEAIENLQEDLVVADKVIYPPWDSINGETILDESHEGIYVDYYDLINVLEKHFNADTMSAETII